MFVVMGLIKKKEGMTKEEFSNHWLNVHGPLAKKMPGVKGYVQNHVVYAQQFDIADAKGTYYDGISMLWYDSEEARIACQNSPEFAAVKEDEKNFMESIDMVYTDRLIVKPMDRNQEYIKRLSFITKHKSMTYERFRFEWQYLHAEIIKFNDHVIGYNQNWVDARFSPRGNAVTVEEMPVDGIVELYYKNEEEVKIAFNMDEYYPRSQSLHTKVLVDTVTPYLVKEYVII